MPRQFGSTLMFTIFLVFIAVAVNRAEENTTSANANAGARGPASVARHLRDDVGGTAGVDLGTDGLAAVPFRHSAKLHGPVETKIELVGDAPATAGDVFTVRGEISSAQQLDQVEYRWSIPAGVELVSGSVTGDIARLGPKQNFVVHLTLRALDDQNQQVFLRANARSRGARFAESTQFNTRLQKEFTRSRARLSKSTLDHLPATKDTHAHELKVFH